MRITIFVIGLLVTSISNAAVQTFTERTSFESAISVTNTIDFEHAWPRTWNGFNSPVGVTFNDVTFTGPWDGGYYLYVGDSENGACCYDAFGSDFLLGEGRGQIEMSILDSSNAIGMDFIVGEAGSGTSDVTFDMLSGESFTITVSREEVNFFGVIGDSPIAGISFRTTLDTRPPQIGLDNVTYGVSEVPLPAAAWLFISAIGGLGVLKRFKKK